MSTSSNRRQFLRALGTAAATLPFYSLLETSAAHAAERPMRLLLLYSAYGGVWDYMRPKGAMKDYGQGSMALAKKEIALTPELLTFPNSVLEPLKAYADRMLVVEGLAMTSGLLPLDEANPKDSRTQFIGHDHTAACVFTGATTNPISGGDPVPTSGSLDFVLGQKLGASTAVPSLQLGIGCPSGVSFYDSLSFNDAGQRLPGISDPQQAFDLLFGDIAGLPTDPAARKRKLAGEKKVVDAVSSSAKRLRARLAGTERAKLDEHLDALAHIEARLGTQIPVDCGTPSAPTGPSESMPDATALHFDILTQAFACDRTRFAVAGWGINTPVNWFFSDIDDMHNAVAHVVSDPGSAGDTARLRMSQYQAWYAGQIATLMDRLAATDDGNGKLLDNTLIVWAQDFGQDVHGGLNVPYVLLGGAQKKFKMGRYLTKRLPVEWPTDDQGYVPNNKLLVSIMNAFGVEGDTFGSNEFKGSLSGLTG